MEKIIIDTDIGVDDALAIFYASKVFKIVGITTVFGNVTVDQATKNAKFFTKLNKITCPIYKGMSRPLAKEITPVIKNIHGEDGLGGVFANRENSDAPDAISFIIDTVNKNPGKITLVAIGPLTNIASAINKDPQIVDKIKRIVLMGGAFGHHGHTGNTSPFAEFNMWKDPHAADQVFRSGIEITVLPLDVTYEVLINASEMLKTHNDTLIKMTAFYLDYAKKVKGFAGMSIHDALTIAYLEDPSAFVTLQKPVRVLTESIAEGQTIMSLSSLNFTNDPFLGVKAATICVGVDVDRVKARLLEIFSL